MLRTQPALSLGYPHFCLPLLGDQVFALVGLTSVDSPLLHVGRLSLCSTFFISKPLIPYEKIKTAGDARASN